MNMVIYHLEANGFTNTGEYVKNITKVILNLNMNFSFQVKIFTSRHNCHGENSIGVFGNYGESRKIFFKLFWYIIGWFRILKILSTKNDMCILHVHWLRFSPIDFFFLKVLCRRRVKLVFTVHNILPHESFFFDKYFYSKIYALFDQLIFHSRQNIIDFKNYFPFILAKKNVVPHYSYDVIPIIPNERKVVNLLFFGTIRPYKGLELLIESIEKLTCSKSWHLIIAGKPEYDISTIEKRIQVNPQLKNNVVFKLGWIKDEDIPILFQNSHIVVLPYWKIDNSGLVHLAMSYGKTIVVPKIGVFKDLIKHGKNGFYFKTGDAQDLSYVLSEVIENADFNEIGKNAVKIMEKHSLVNIGRQLIKIYKSLI